MGDTLRNEVLKRDKGICQICQKKLFKTLTVVRDDYEEAVAMLSSIKEIPIYKWKRKCWNCERETLIVNYDLQLDSHFSLGNMGDFEKLDEILIEKYPFVKKVFSKTQGREVIANTCVHCGSLQGSWFIIEDIHEKEAEGEDMNKMIDIVLSNKLTPEDLLIQKGSPKSYEATEITKPYEIHHKDWNWENNELSNLVLVCKECHKKLRPIGNSKPTRSRKAAREEARIRKEKSQTNHWREKYYASRAQKKHRNKS
jgi:hypothetical protein